MNKKVKTRQTLLQMLWRLENAQDSCVIDKSSQRRRKQFCKKYNCSEKDLKIWK